MPQYLRDPYDPYCFDQMRCECNRGIVGEPQRTFKVNPKSSFVKWKSRKEKGMLFVIVLVIVLFPKMKRETLVPAFAGQHALFLVVDFGRRHLRWADSPLQTEYRSPFSHFEPDFDDLMIFDACRFYSFYGFLNASSHSFSPLKFHQSLSHVCFMFVSRSEAASTASTEVEMPKHYGHHLRELRHTHRPASTRFWDFDWRIPWEAYTQTSVKMFLCNLCFHVQLKNELYPRKALKARSTYEISRTLVNVYSHPSL